MTDAALPARGGPEPTAERVDAARGPWSLVWSRLRRDRLAFVGGVVFLTVALVCFVGGPIAAYVLGHGPNDPFPYAINENLKPVGPLTYVPDVNEFVDVNESTPETLFILGGDGSLGRDLFLRVLYGGQVSLIVGLGATLLALAIGIPLGLLSGYAGGWLDWSISRWTDLVMGFPLLLFIVAIGYTVGFRLSDITLGGIFQPGVLVLVFLIGIFSWFLPARVVRAQVLSLRDAEFVDAARMIGAGDVRVMRAHILPHVLPPMLVWAALMTAGFIFFEAALSVLNVGLKLPTASWGTLISTNWGTLLVFDPNRSTDTFFVDKSHWVVFAPTVALLVSVVSLALFAEGLRRALDPKGIG
jgi:peptide/nickel transport system permease protein